MTQLSPTQRDLLLTSASQLVGLLSAAVVGGDAKAVESGAWIAKNATQYNFLNHYEMEDFVGDMQACKDDACYRNTWTAQYGDTNYDQLSQDNLKDALETVGPARAKDLLGQIQGGLAALGELQCSTATCDAYKFTLIDRALTAKASLQQTYVEGQGIIAGALIAPVGVIGAAAKEVAAAAEANSAQKAYAYWTEVRSGRATGEATSLASAVKLRAKLTGQEISGGHAFEKHVVQQGEYKALGITTREQFSSHIENVVGNPTYFRELSGGRTAYWDKVSGTVVIRNPKAVDGGTAFRPVNGQAYFDNLR